MKHLKASGLIALAAMAVVALIGAGTASASTVCKANETTCSAANTYANGTAIKGTLASGTKAVLKGILTVECSASEVAGKLTSNPGAKGEITSASWTSCTRSGGGGCEPKPLSLPWTVEGVATGSGNGEMWVGPGASGAAPGAELTNCGIGSGCQFRANETHNGSNKWAKLTFTGDTPAKAKAAISLSGGVCGAATWNAEYVFSPSPMFLSKSP